MNKKSSVSVLILMLITVLVSATIIRGAVQTGNCCLWQVHKKANGARTSRFGPNFECVTGRTARGDTTIELRLNSEGQPCDQSNLIPDNSVLKATGATIRRDDGFAHFSGAFTIRTSAGALLVEGTMEVIDRIGTHHPPFGNEACNERNHFEGWLAGRGSGRLRGYTLHALIVANFNQPTATSTTTVTASIDGALKKCS